MLASGLAIVGILLSLRLPRTLVVRTQPVFPPKNIFEQDNVVIQSVASVTIYGDYKVAALAARGYV